MQFSSKLHFCFVVNQSVWVYPERESGTVELRRRVDTDKGVIKRYLISFNNGQRAGWFNERNLEVNGQVALSL
jgi:hypothetical protein